MAKSTVDMLNELKIFSIKDLSTEQIKLLYNKYVVKPSKNNKPVVKNNLPAVDKTDNKYLIALKFINKILINIKKNPVDDLTKFQNIDRDDIILDINKKTLADMENEIYKYFDKTKLCWYKRKKIKHYILTILRGISKELGLKFSYVQKNIVTGRLNKTCLFYSII